MGRPRLSQASRLTSSENTTPDGANLLGGRREIALFHYAIDGLLLDRLTTPIDPETPVDDVIDDLVAGLLR